MSRLVVVSNRLAHPTDGVSPGGLAVAMRGVLQSSGGVWAGWSGDLVESEAETGIELQAHNGVHYAKLALPRRAFHKYYEDFSNGVLWPLLHGRPDLVKYDQEDFLAYRDINRTFAKLVNPLVRPGDLIWVHDYHLLPLAAELRAWARDNPIGYFHHVPFPAPEIIRSLPNRDALIAALASYSVFGVQTRRDQANLASLLSQDYGARQVDDDVLELFGRQIRIRAFPIGVEAGRARAVARNGGGSPEIRQYLGHFRVDRRRRLIVGVDRLDYSKGLPHKLAAFARLLDLRPDLAKTVTFLQIAPLSREGIPAYQELRCEVEQLVGRINGRYGSLAHQPVVFLTKGLPHDDIMRLLAESHVGYVTSLMDGMNLIAKEFVDAQDPEDPGQLVLSQFAGAAEDMTSALLVNPYDADSTALALIRALEMPRSERRERHLALLRCVERTDVGRWSQSFVSALAETADTIEDPMPERLAAE